MTRDTDCFTTALSHVTVLLTSYVLIHAVSLSIYPVVRRIYFVL